MFIKSSRIQKLYIYEIKFSEFKKKFYINIILIGKKLFEISNDISCKMSPSHVYQT
jgi:hypothetical protein